MMLKTIIYIIISAIAINGQEQTAEYIKLKQDPFAGSDPPVSIAILKFSGDWGIENKLFKELNSRPDLKSKFTINSYEWLSKNKRSLGVTDLNPVEKTVREALKKMLGVSYIVTGEANSSDNFTMRIIRTNDGSNVYECDYQKSSNSTGIKDAVKLFSDNERTDYKEKPKMNDCSEVSYGGKTYKTVKIGTQCWLKENLDVGTMINSTTSGGYQQTNNGVIEKYCYDNNPANCNTYGGLYEWTEAMQYVTTPGTRGICPPGWHIPTIAEFETLKAAVNNDGNALKSIGQGKGSGVGTNTSGFSALLSGYRYLNGDFSYLGSDADFWSSTEFNSGYAYYLSLYPNVSNINLRNLYKDFGFSVRCVKD